MSWTLCVLDFGGDKLGRKGKYTEKIGVFLTLQKKEGRMGFRDLRSFNLAMLTKQGWRLLQDKSSVLYSVHISSIKSHPLELGRVTAVKSLF